nr:MAG TPA: hypothetical protein [Caudoviricetes sp.]
MCHERFPEYKTCHFRVWLIMQHKIQQMVGCFFLAPAIGVSV